MRNVYVLEEFRTTLASVIKTYDNAFVITRYRCQPIAFKVLIGYMPVKRLYFLSNIFRVPLCPTLCRWGLSEAI
jgi:hypothetical protein